MSFRSFDYASRARFDPRRIGLETLVRLWSTKQSAVNYRKETRIANRFYLIRGLTKWNSKEPKKPFREDLIASPSF